MRHRPRESKRRESQVPFSQVPFSQVPAQAGGDTVLLDHFNIYHERPRATHCIVGPGLLPGCRLCKAKQGAKRRFTHDRGLLSPVGTRPAGRCGSDLTIHSGSDQGFMLRYLAEHLATYGGPSSSGLCLFSIIVIYMFFFGNPPRPAEAQNCTGSVVCEPEVRPASRSPGARTGYEVTFVTPVGNSTSHQQHRDGPP